jgi:hypothetical protein
MGDKTIIEAAKSIVENPEELEKLSRLAQAIINLKLKYLQLNYGSKYTREELLDAIDVWDYIGIVLAQVYLEALAEFKNRKSAMLAVALMFSEHGRTILAERFRALDEVLELEKYFTRKKGGTRERERST